MAIPTPHHKVPQDGPLATIVAAPGQFLAVEDSDGGRYAYRGTESGKLRAVDDRRYASAAQVMEGRPLTRDNIEVRQGQIWRDLDKRSATRHCKVQAVRDGKAIMCLCTESGRIINSIREVKISISRMHKASTGWALVRDAH